MSNQSKKNGSCLKTGLIAIGALVVIALLASFGWIAGIIWLIFFRKKLNDNPKKQKNCYNYCFCAFRSFVYYYDIFICASFSAGNCNILRYARARTGT